jgi:hypothetical protein
MTECGEYVNPKRARAVAAILAALPATKRQIEGKTGLSHTTICKVISALHPEDPQKRQMHIGGWLTHPVRGPSMAVYHDGPGEDVPDTLPRLTKKQIADRFEKRLKGTEKHDQRKARHRSRHWEKKAMAAPKSWAAALGL